MADIFKRWFNLKLNDGRLTSIEAVNLGQCCIVSCEKRQRIASL